MKTETSFQKSVILSQLWPLDIFELFIWAKDYDKYSVHPATILNRFLLGFYQIHQGMSWTDCGVNKYESYAASFLHLAMVSENLKLPIEVYFEEVKINAIPKIDQSSLIFEQLLFNLSASAQQLFYSSNADKTQRSKRYNPKKLTKHLGISMYTLISLIPKDMRQSCFWEASGIMTKLL